jgi:hypothetical protein
MGKSVKQYMTDNPDLRAALGVTPLNDQQNPDSSPPRPTTASSITVISIRPPSAAALAAAPYCIGPYTGGPYTVATGSRARPSPPRGPFCREPTSSPSTTCMDSTHRQSVTSSTAATTSSHPLTSTISGAQLTPRPKESPPTKGTSCESRSLGKISTYVKCPAKVLGILKRKCVEPLSLSEDPAQSTANSGSADEVIGGHACIPEEEEVAGLTADEIQEIPREEEEESDFEDESSDDGSFDDSLFEVPDLTPYTGKVVRLSKEKSEKMMKRFVGMRNLYDKNLLLGISCDETDEMLERGEIWIDDDVSLHLETDQAENTHAPVDATVADLYSGLW